MKILLGVSGGIAAYKSAEIVRAFKKRGDEVRVVVTSGAMEFITPLTLQVLSENDVGADLFDPTLESQIGHIDLARWPDVILVAPATANFIARYANGFCDDLLTTILSATFSPVVIAPAMNTQMLLNPKTQRNIVQLKADGAFIIEPDSGELACKEVGAGRLPDSPVLVEAVLNALEENRSEPQILVGKKILIAAGPTREFLDPARFLSNPSTGKMGYALAKSAKALGAQVTLVSGPSALPKPAGLDFRSVISTNDLFNEVTSLAGEMDVVVMAAAPADWTPKHRLDHKEAKVEGEKNLTFVRTKDILKHLGESYSDTSPFLIGFAAESHDVLERGKAKRVRKKCDALIANKIGGEDNAFGSDENQVYVITADLELNLDRAPKIDIAYEIWRTLSERI